MSSKMVFFEEMNKLTEQGYLRKVISECGDLVLYNYTDKTTYERYWNNLTLNARGTVYSLKEGITIARAFPKFFNFEELELPIRNNILSQKNFEVFEKFDGSLGVMYNYNGKWRVNTRGSFSSEQAIKATEMLSKYNLDNINPRLSLLVEIIYPENRIIVDYGDNEELVLLAAMSKSGIENSHDSLISIGELSGLRVATKYKYKSIEDLILKQQELGKFEEGFVVRFNDGFRCKFKSKEYLKLAKIMSNMTPLNFWANMSKGSVNKHFLIDIPEEFKKDVDFITEKLENVYKTVYNEINDDFNYAIKSIGGLSDDLDIDRRSLGMWLKDNKKEIKHHGSMFSKLLKLDESLEGYIMKTIKPTGNIL